MSKLSEERVRLVASFTTKLRRSYATPQSFNRYSYVQNDPVNLVDPSGMVPSAGCGADQSFADCYGSGGGTFWGDKYRGNNGWGDDPNPGLWEIGADELRLHPRDVVVQDIRVPYHFHFSFEGWMSFFGFVPQKRSDTSGDSAIKVPAVKEQPNPGPSKLDKCYEGWRFSTAVSELFRGTSAQKPVKFAAGLLEVVGPMSTAEDGVAIAFKARRVGIGAPENTYASGLNMLFRETLPVSTRRTMFTIGTRATPFLSGAGAFTTGYNLAVGVGCSLGVNQ